MTIRLRYIVAAYASALILLVAASGGAGAQSTLGTITTYPRLAEKVALPEPFQQHVELFVAVGTPQGQTEIQVPAGKRLVIEHLTGGADVPPGQRMLVRVALVVQDDAQYAEELFTGMDRVRLIETGGLIEGTDTGLLMSPGRLREPSGVRDHISYSRNTKMDVPEGGRIVITTLRSLDQLVGSVFASMSVIGYLVAAP